MSRNRPEGRQKPPGSLGEPGGIFGPGFSCAGRYGAQQLIRAQPQADVQAADTGSQHAPSQQSGIAPQAASAQHALFWAQAAPQAAAARAA